jgi:putative DNA primase/helicase
VFTMTRKICREIAKDEKQKELHRRVAANGATVARVERLLRYDPRITANADQWDRDPMLLNTPGGTVDLRTGEMREHRREDFITLTAAATPAPPGTPCPTKWAAFLERVFNGDADLIAYVQKVAGYCTTGETGEHVFWFCFGTGRNGKTTFVDVLADILGDYAMVTQTATLLATRNDKHTADLAALRGARLVVASETEKGRAWAEARLKGMVAGDPISCQHMRREWFTYTPEFKVIVIGNNRPTIRNPDEAMRARLHLVPFNAFIPEAERDKRLAHKLQKEWPAILRWMIDGCIQWQKDGHLKPPPAVADASAEYFEAEDTFAAWKSEHLEEEFLANRFETSADLFRSWRQWSDQNGSRPGTHTEFAESLKKHFTKGVEGHDNIRVYWGARFRKGKEPLKDDASAKAKNR